MLRIGLPAETYNDIYCYLKHTTHIIENIIQQSCGEKYEMHGYAYKLLFAIHTCANDCACVFVYIRKSSFNIM